MSRNTYDFTWSPFAARIIIAVVSVAAALIVVQELFPQWTVIHPLLSMRGTGSPEAAMRFLRWMQFVFADIAVLSLCLPVYGCSVQPSFGLSYFLSGLLAGVALPLPFIWFLYGLDSGSDALLGVMTPMQIGMSFLGLVLLVAAIPAVRAARDKPKYR